MPIADLNLLRRAEMFGSLPTEALADIAAAGLPRRLVAGERIFAQGDPGVTCHTLMEGRVKIVQTLPDGTQAVLRFIGPGEMYGTVAALMDQPFPADAIAVTESVELRWGVSNFRELMRRHPEIGVRSTASAGTRLFDLQNRISELSTERVEQRIARAVLRLAEQAGRPTPQGTEIDFPITRQELAEMTGSTLHTVSRTLAAWDQAGVTASARRRVIVRDRAALQAMADH
ncbi:Crp/Fnr family transcriptional regulator [Brevundimonas sp. 2R-24]|uniref:Crp/Fnr family transcriptional regulator n=1 Tax=Peiella sedimenti TaxID=3061083 RepID=A0ABT8SLU3_9CAUL|nr:Crp/Fnr family transcriptional regulator [Caulobacteraceae bacterium XZ-24]